MQRYFTVRAVQIMLEMLSDNKDCSDLLFISPIIAYLKEGLQEKYIAMRTMRQFDKTTANLEDTWSELDDLERYQHLWLVENM